MRRTLPLLALTLAACAPPRPAGRPTRTPPSSAPSTDALAEPWIVGPAMGEHTHEIRLEGILVSRLDSLERTDTLFTGVRSVTSYIVGGARARLSGLVIDLRVGGGDSASRVLPAGLVLPQPFSAELGSSTEQPRLVQPPGAECSAAAAAAQALRELWLSPPPRLTIGLEWSDSATYTICRDSIPLRVTSARRFVVLGAERRSSGVAVLVERVSTTQFAGEGTQFGEPLRIEAVGQSTMRLSLSLLGGVVLDGVGAGELTMTMRGRRRAQELWQRTQITISSP